MSKKLFIIVLAVLLLLAGCAVQNDPEGSKSADPFNSPDPMPEYDADNRYYEFRDVGVRVQKAGDILFGASYSYHYIHYYDLASGVSGVLCADPSCTHDSVSCAAYVEDSSAICYYNGKRYWISYDPQGGMNDRYLFRSDLTGENMERVKRIDYDGVIKAYQPQWYYIHRGMLYFLGRKSTYEDGKTGYRMSLMCSPLDSSEEFIPLFDEFTEQWLDVEVRFVANSIYCAVTEYPISGIDTTNIVITRYDRETGAAETVFEENECLEYLFEFWIEDDGTIYLGGEDSDGATLWRIENGEKVEIHRENEPNSFDLAGDVATFVTLVDGQKWIKVFNLAGEQLYEGPMYPEPIEGMEDDPNDCSWSLSGGDGDEGTIIIHLEGANRREYTVLLDATNGMKGTLLWSNS